MSDNTREHAEMARIVGELAGYASLCWVPRPIGVFDSAKAVIEVDLAIKELRTLLDEEINAFAAALEQRDRKYSALDQDYLTLESKVKAITLERDALALQVAEIRSAVEDRIAHDETELHTMNCWVNTPTPGCNCGATKIHKALALTQTEAEQRVRKMRDALAQIIDGPQAKLTAPAFVVWARALAREALGGGSRRCLQ